MGADRKDMISIWLFIGLLLLAYGVIILGAGIAELFWPPVTHTVLAELHASLWWGALLLVLGGVFVGANSKW